MSKISLITPEEEKKFTALDIMKDIRMSILRQGFGIQNRLHYDFKFHSTLYNGLGTVMNIFVHYHTNIPKVLIKITHNNDILQFCETDYTRSTLEYEKFFTKIHSELVKKFSIGLFEVDFYEKSKKVY